jgi:deoxyribodipyrimidine photolyase-related protein
MSMPDYEDLNYFNHSAPLPSWFWTGKTKMECLKQSIGQSLDHAYAHHIQRLMITGNFMLLAGIDPSEVDRWYLGIYIDAFQWVEITNTRGMSQFADGGWIATKPYVSSANYIHKMSDYCAHCPYDRKTRAEKDSCPFNALYWDFYERNEGQLGNNPRIGMVYRTLNKMKEADKVALRERARWIHDHLENL